MEKILISSCLLGDPVRYDGNSKPIRHSIIRLWLQQGRLVSFSQAQQHLLSLT